MFHKRALPAFVYEGGYYGRVCQEKCVDDIL